MLALFIVAIPIATVVLAQAANCPPNTVLGSNFEIDVNANLVVSGNASTNRIDWLTGGSGTLRRIGVLAKPDLTTGSGDDSFDQGTDENDAMLTIVNGSIPPNKSDLKAPAVYVETSASGKFLELIWSRV